MSVSITMLFKAFTLSVLIGGFKDNLLAEEKCRGTSSFNENKVHFLSLYPSDIDAAVVCDSL